jgi:hypothetical protein
MKIRDFSPIKAEDGKYSLEDRLRGTLRYGFSWYREMQSQQFIIERLQKIFGKEYILMRNIILPDLEFVVPFILLGPPGVSVIYAEGKRGVFHAKSETWLEMENRGQGFKDANPNLITHTLTMARAVESFVSREDFIMEADGVLIMTHPGTHVESNRPAVRVVLRDAVERFATQVSSQPEILDSAEIQRLADKFTAAHEVIFEEREQEKGALSRGAKTSIRTAETRVEGVLAKLQVTFNFSPRQWFVLLAAIAAEVILLIIFIIVIFLSS